MKIPQVPHGVLDPKTGKEITTPLGVPRGKNLTVELGTMLCEIDAKLIRDRKTNELAASTKERLLDNKKRLQKSLKTTN